MGSLRDNLKEEISKWFDHNTPVQDIEDITSAVLALILKKLPEKKPEIVTDGIIRVNGRDSGWNAAISEVRSILGEK